MNYILIKYSIEENLYKDMELDIYKAENLNNIIIAGNLANVIVNTGLAYSREIEISESVSNLIINIDRWRKIDPPIPLDVVSISVPDVVIKSEEKSAVGEAVAVLKNLHSGDVEVLLKMDIYGGMELVGSYVSDSYVIKPEETIEVKIPFGVKRSTLVDVAGYRSVITVNLAEPGTMSLSDQKGPYIAHFYAGTELQNMAFRENINISQPLGGVLKGGEQNEIKYSVYSKDTKEIRFVLASRMPSKMELHIYDEAGNHVGTTGESYENNISGAEVFSLRNTNDMVIIRNPHGSYKIVVKLPEGERNRSIPLKLLS